MTMFGSRHRRQARRRAASIVAALLVCAAVVPLSGCGASKTPNIQHPHQSNEPAYAVEPLTHEQRLVEQGARLVVSDGCSSCHLNASRQSLAPSFASFAGQRVTLTDGRHALVEERFLREALLHPRRNPIKGYALAPMLAAVERLHLSGKPQQVAALAAFIEQIGPEPG
jgi:hypothetical protein